MRATAAPLFDEVRFTARDGLRLYARVYRAQGEAAPGRPALCLAGLTRNSRDFHVLASALASDSTRPRDVWTLDTRGRGHSDHDPDWRNYAVPIEMLDVLDLMVMQELTDVALVGTSRGGLIAMVMAAAQPSTIGAAVLVDIGPVLETEGLLRILGYVGKMPVPVSWADAGRVVGELNRKHFPNIGADEWIEIARQLFNEKGGKPVASYDPQVARSMSVLEGPMPELWPQFAALNRVPVMVVRGENSDLLSAATVAEMERRHPACISHVVPSQGHAPWLRDNDSIAAIAEFLRSSDASMPDHGANRAPAAEGPIVA
ncbi:MAG: alpha/beta fold hydrolase [Hyphomicrobiaceae bacterium]